MLIWGGFRMKKIILITSLLMISSCYAWKIINTEQYIQEAQTQLSEESLKLQETLDARLPISSLAQPGKVENKSLDQVNFTSPIFIIGDDPLSHRWLKEHAKELEAKQALGFVANITDSKHLDALQQLTKAPLLPANVDDLMTIFDEAHYPLAFNDGALWQ